MKLKYFLDKILITVIIFTLYFCTTGSISASNKGDINLYLFYGNGCPHCAKEREFLHEYKEANPDSIELYEFEIYYNQENSKFFNRAINDLNIDRPGVPLLIIGDEAFVGYTDDETTGREIVEIIEKKEEVKKLALTSRLSSFNNYLYKPTTHNPSKVRGTSSPKSSSEESESANSEPVYLNVPILGKVDLKKLSVPIATILIAFMDGFNPCAMWILIFLITMLINMKDKKRLYILGTVFILTSGIVYFAFLAAWFNLFKLLGYVRWIKIAIGIVAIISGILHLKSAISSKGGCKSVDKKKRKSIMEKIKSVINQKRFFLAIIGIMSVAVSVNIIEVVCSAGLPSIYTNLLSTIQLSTFGYYSYLLLYIIIFMLDDLFIFFIAIKSFEVTGITSKYTKWSSIVGGVLIFILGVLLIFKPELLMFG